MRALHLLAAVLSMIILGWSPYPASAETAPTVATRLPVVSNQLNFLASYRFGAGDKLRVLTFNEPSLSGDFSVNELGRVALPLIGDVQAGGLTLDEFTENVTKALANGFLVNPRVSVEVLNYRPYYILGEVAKPGEYPFVNGLTVMNAAATAGGFTYRANTRRVFIRHAMEPKERATSLTSATVVLPGDTIRIPERFF